MPLRQRTTFKDLADALGVKKSTLHNRFKEGYFRRHTNDLKFSLTDANKKARVKYCLSMLNAQSLSFKPMYNVVYIDEKWFYRTRRNQKYYLAIHLLQQCRSGATQRGGVVFCDSAAWPRCVGYAATNFNGRERRGIFQATGDGAASIAAFDTSTASRTTSAGGWGRGPYIRRL